VVKNLLLILLIPLSTLGQEYLPFTLENVKWTNGYYSLNTNDPNFYFLQLIDTEIFESSTDTIINGTTYTKIISNSVDQPYAGSLREEEGKVFMVPPDSTSERILYDFTLTLGDSILIIDDGHTETILMIVNEISQIEIEGLSHKVIRFDQGGKWIEGIGAEPGLFMSAISNISGGATYLECFELNGNQVFSADQSQGCLLSASYGSSNSETAIFPNPSSGEIQIQGIDGIASYQLTDPTGRIVREETSGLNLKIDFSDERKGFHLLRIKSEQGWSTHRLILK
jgi:hypothetical protein